LGSIRNGSTQKIAILSAAHWRLNSAKSQRRHPEPARRRVPAGRVSRCDRRIVPPFSGFLESRKYPMLAWIRRWFAEATDQAIIRVVATLVGLSAYIVWGGYSYLHPGNNPMACKANCATEFSSRQRAE
jgi:hypothetical protein